MAVKDDEAYHPTESLILSSPRRHLIASISRAHWQLRSLICAEGSTTVYFPTGPGNTRIQRLDTTSRVSEVVSVLPYEPRCLAAGHGVICSGGELGEFSVIDAGASEGATADDSDLVTHLDLALSVDPTFDLDLSPGAEIGADADAGSNNPRVRQTIRALLGSPKVTTKKVGKDRVNCITLWFLPSRDDESVHAGAYDGGVAVLANNDRSVSVVSLGQQETLDEIRYPDCVNRAVISPDGGLLIAVTDDPYLYVHERSEKSVETANGIWPDGTAYRWRWRNKIHLFGQSKEDSSDNRGSFAVCFSPSGRYLAAGTQYGVISIFDTTTLTDSSVISLITSFKSSKPGVPQGAVRDMEFAPGPIDLLAWTEDMGRVGVADMRTGCISRQIIHLDKEDGVEQKKLTDRASINPRLLSPPSAADIHDTLASSLATTLDMAPETRTTMEQLNRPLSRDETVVLEALQAHNRVRAQRAAGAGSNPGSNPTSSRRQTPSDGGWEVFRTARRGGTDTLRGVSGPQVNNVALERAPERAATDAAAERRSEVQRQQAIILIHTIAAERQRDRIGAELNGPSVGAEIEARQEERLRELRNLLRIRDASRLSPSISPDGPSPPSRPNPLGGRLAALDDELAAQLANRRAITSRIMAHYPASNDGASANAWTDLEALYNLSQEHGVPSDEGLRSAVDADARRRERAAFLLRQWEAGPLRHGYAIRRDDSMVDDPYDTEGLAWSEDGRKLYVGCNNGIYEFQVNMLNRKFYPTMDVR